MDDNPVENAIRPSAVGKKNYLFLGSSDSGHWAATFYSLIGSCLRRKINPREYLHWLFTKLPTVSAPIAGQFTPAAYAALRTQGAPITAAAYPPHLPMTHAPFSSAGPRKQIPLRNSVESLVASPFRNSYFQFGGYEGPSF